MQNRNLYHWLVVGCCSAIMAVVYGVCLNASGVFFVPVAEALGSGRGDIAMYITIMNLVTGFSAPFAAKCIRKLPLRAWLITGGALITGSMALWPVVTALWQLYVLAFVHGIGSAMLGNVVLNMIINAWFRRSVGLALGIVFSASGVAGALLSPVFQSLIDRFGWQTSHNVAAVLCAVLTLPGVIFLRMTPEETHRRPYGEGAAEPTSGRKPARRFMQDASGERSAVGTILLIGVFASFLTGIGTHVAGYGTSIGLTAAQGALLVSAMMAGNMSGKLLFGLASDRIGPALSMKLFIAATVVGLAGLIVLRSFILLMAACVLLGFVYSLTNIGLSRLTAMRFTGEKRDRYFAWAQTAANIGNSIASAVIGYMYDLSGTYRPAFLLCVGMDLVILACTMAVFRPVKRTAAGS